MQLILVVTGIMRLVLSKFTILTSSWIKYNVNRQFTRGNIVINVVHQLLIVNKREHTVSQACFLYKSRTSHIKLKECNKVIST